ncbi:hypothetical protein AVEN_254185-1 [Araneus ventricosus]|uniref:Uncharacterized protein n=1 Tax=Araneus ventricosus TaxID=182803 RepID=A0A4Y2RP12_ARAVE|nr:hypothetical protein AVEN_254185-1 [Araneus ventricosus]
MPCSYKPLDISDQQTSLIRFLIEELGVPHHHPARQTVSELPPLPLPPHRLVPPKSSSTNRQVFHLSYRGSGPLRGPWAPKSTLLSIGKNATRKVKKIIVF